MSRPRPSPLRADDPRILSEAQCAAIAKRILAAAQGGGETEVRIQSWWSGDIRWGRNQVMLVGDRRNLMIKVKRTNSRTNAGGAVTNQIDDESLVGVVRTAERSLSLHARVAPSLPNPPYTYTYGTPAIWSEATVKADVALRRDTCQAMIAMAEQQKMLSAGYLEHRLASRANYDSWGRAAYAPYTVAQCTTTVRNSAGTGSGWAGLSSHDWARIDPVALGTRALEKCLASQDPVALEPGRYTVILEPQAVGDLTWTMFHAMYRPGNENPWYFPMSPFQLRPGDSKLGLKMFDDRISISFDPADPELGVMPFGWIRWAKDVGEMDWEPPRAASWITNGVVTALPYERDYGLGNLRENLPQPFVPAVRMSGGETSINEMIQTTARGLLVTRLARLTPMGGGDPLLGMFLDAGTALQNGVTRDGLWLIENGQITKPVKNFRFTESPLFMLNNVEQLGRPVPILSPGLPGQFPELSQMVVPPIKARDFSFTSMADAV